MSDAELMADLEHFQLKAFFDWAALHGEQIPALRLLYAIPECKPTRTVALRLKAAGVKRGVLDVNLPVARGGAIGLYIEFKAGNCRLTPAQDWWANELAKQGHQVWTVWDWRQAKEIVLNYLGADVPAPFAARH